MNQTLTFIFLIFLFISCYVHPQESYRVMWYNVENLFDTVDNPEKDDNEFLPQGNRRWSYRRYHHKLQQIAKVITAAGEWDTPALIGLCEVENDSVIHHLLNRTPLKQQEYRFLITETRDVRGINVALLYQRNKFKLLNFESIEIPSVRSNKINRDILYVSGKVISGDTLDLFLCHFPSRYGGEKESEKERMNAASILRKVCDSVIYQRNKPFLIIMGDLNDNPENKSIREVLGAFPSSSLYAKNSMENSFINLIPSSSNKNIRGTHKYQGEWSQLDHIIVYKNLLNPENNFCLKPGSVQIFHPNFLLTPDKTWRGVRPKRTYYGFKYEGGYSDHLPLIADFLLYLPILY